MAFAVGANSLAKCSFGIAPSALQVPPSKVTIGGNPVATVAHSLPNVNVMSFGACTSTTNPAVAAALLVPPIGVLKPQPCTPLLPGTPWVGCASKVSWSGQPPLTTDGCLTCVYGGNISLIPGTGVKVKV